MPLNLAEVPSDDLITELAKRNDAIVFAQTSGDEWGCVFSGNGLLCRGLLDYADEELEAARSEMESGNER